MSDGGAGFEAKLDRIDAIVKELENPDTKLDRAIALFKEGKVLARECEALLKSAQAQIDEAMSEPKSANPNERSKSDELDDQIPF
ncbi:MAG TPA: exodeoxyribonuclease VII small subunit [Candidatus Dormibacteraeota bacterium]|nr:exodeoxyribonuclease VII small subunit [Candidatus Dormibacteraeota bacterium]